MSLDESRFRRDDVLAAAARVADEHEAALFVGNGYNARAVAALADRPRSFFMVGSMGLCPTLAAGYAHARGEPVVAIEGDGNALMGLSGFPVVARAATERFVHVVLDNGLYETTGGQTTLASGVDFGLLALASGYARVYRPQTLESVATAVEAGLGDGGSTFVYVRTEPGADPLHPRVPYHPREIARRFREAVGAG
jgi:thiamine pyrophosphate-dependent acetolactate synthase large subunit-like protein